MSFKQTYGVDAKQAERAFKTLESLQEKIGDETEKTTKRLSAQEKQAKRIAEQADPTKRYARQMQELATHVKAGRVNMDDAVVVATKYQQRLEGAGKAGQSAFGSRAFSSLATYAAGFVSLSGAIGGVRQLFTAIKQEATEAAARVRDSLDAIGELQQLEGFGDNVEFVKELRRQGVVANATQGANFAFALDSAGLNQRDQDFVAYQLVKNRFFSAEQAPEVALAASKAQGLLGFGSLEETFQKFTQASGGTAANIPSLATATTKFASAFGALGYSGDEALSALEVADKGSGSISAAAERLKSLSVQIDKRGLQRGTFLETIQAIQARVAKGENAFDILGETNAVAGFRLFDDASEQSAYAKSLGLVGSAQQRDVLGGRLGGLRSDPILGPAVLAEERQRSRETAQEDATSRLTSLFAAASDARAEAYLRQGRRVDAAGVDYYRGTLSFFNQERSGLEQFLQVEQRIEATGQEGFLPQDLQSQIVDYLRETATNTRQSADQGGSPAAE